MNASGLALVQLRACTSLASAAPPQLIFSSSIRPTAVILLRCLVPDRFGPCRGSGILLGYKVDSYIIDLPLALPISSIRIFSLSCCFYPYTPRQYAKLIRTIQNSPLSTLLIVIPLNLGFLSNIFNWCVVGSPNTMPVVSSSRTRN